MAPRMGAKQAGRNLATTDPPCTLPTDLDCREDRVGALSDGRAEALLRSALEKIVYFEAQSEQLQGDATTLRAEADQLRAELAAASSREVDLRRRVAELEVELARAHRERGEGARVLEAMRSERDGLMGKVLDAARIQGAAAHGGPDFDLAGFISELRSEALALRGGELPPAIPDSSPIPPAWMLAPRNPEPRFPATPSPEVRAAALSAPASAVRTPSFASVSPRAPVPVLATAPAVPAPATREAERLFQQGRLGVPSVTRFGEESLFGFSVRELSSPDPSARVRAAERLRMLGERAAAPALAVALHGERDPTVLVALLDAFRPLAGREGTPVVAPLLDSPDSGVRIAALRAITTLDPDSAASYLARAAHDAEPSVRRRAALLAVTLGPERMLDLEREAARDPDPEVRRLVVLAVGAAGGDAAKGRLLASLDDGDLGVRRAAARSLSRLLGLELGHVPELSDDERRREIRRLSTLQPPPLAVRARLDEPLPEPVPDRAPPDEIDLALPQESWDPGPPPELHSDEALCLQIAQELQGAMRGRTVVDLAGQLGVTGERVVEAAALLAARGQVVRRGTKLFVA